MEINSCGTRQHELDEFDDSIISNIPNDTEAAIIYVQNTAGCKDSMNMPTVVLLHQVYDIIRNRKIRKKELANLQEDGKIVLFSLRDGRNSRVVIFYEDLKQYTLSSVSPKNYIYVKQFLDVILHKNKCSSISRETLARRCRFTEQIISLLVSEGLLILQDVGKYEFTFPFAGTFVKRIRIGREIILKIIRTRKYHEILQSELETRDYKNKLPFCVKYHLLDIIGAKLVSCVDTTSGRLLRSLD